MQVRRRAGDQTRGAGGKHATPPTVDGERAPGEDRTSSAAGGLLRLQRLAGNRAAAALLQASGDSVDLQRDTPRTPGPGNRPPPAPEPPDYDRDPKSIAMPPRGLTKADVTRQLNQLVTQRKLTTYAVSGIPNGSQAEIFLLSLIFAVADRSRWGSEIDLVTAVGWPASAQAPAPKGRVTVRLDRQGNVTAELIGTGPVPAVPQTTFAAGSARLTGADFGFASVAGWSGQKPQDASEISIVIAALELLRARSPQSVAALAGVELIRVATLPQNRAGEFFAGSSTALGQAADVPASLKVADRAFDSDAVMFLGGSGSPTVPASFQLVLHEVGHAVANQDLRTARTASVKAIGEAQAAATLVAGDPAAYDAAQKAARRKGRRALEDFYKAQAEAYRRNTAASDAANQRKIEASDRLNATRDPASGQTKRLKKFVDLVTANNIRRFTKYSADNWASQPEEFYAEAYSLWLTDPTFLRTNYRVVFEFFETGEFAR